MCGIQCVAQLANLINIDSMAKGLYDSGLLGSLSGFKSGIILIFLHSYGIVLVSNTISNMSAILIFHFISMFFKI